MYSEKICDILKLSLQNAWHNNNNKNNSGCVIYNGVILVSLQ